MQWLVGMIKKQSRKNLSDKFFRLFSYPQIYISEQVYNVYITYYLDVH